jgi:hypothetical protein
MILRSSNRKHAVHYRARVHPQRVLLFALLLLLAGLVLFVSSVSAQNVSIGTATADNSALLHLESTSKGLLIPRLTDAQMQAVSSPATGDLVWNSTYTNFYYYNGSYWTTLTGSGWSTTGDAGTSPSTNFLGTKDSVDLVQKTNNRERMRFFAGGSIGLTNTLNQAERLILYEPSSFGSFYTAFKAGRQDSTIHYTLPPADGINGQALCDSLGILGWKTFGTVGGGFGDTLWKRGSGASSLFSLGSGNKTNGKWSIASTLNSNGGGEASSVFGDSNSSSAKYGCVTGGSNNSVSGQGGSTIRGGWFNSAGSQNTMIIGGLYNNTSGQNSVILGGDSNSCSGGNAVILNGADNSFASQNNLIFGYNAHITGQNQLVFLPPTTPSAPLRTGIQTTTPAEALDVGGNVQLSGTGTGVLKPNGAAGTSGQYLKSAGSGSPPTWGTITLPSNNWGLSGTFGSNPATNFIGTVDSIAFVVRTNATERFRIHARGPVGVNTSTSSHQLASVNSGTTDETAGVYGVANGATTNQIAGVWGRANNTSTSNTGTIALLATGNGSTTGGATNVGLQISQGEFAMGRTTESPSAGTTVEGATAGTLYTAQGPSGVIQLNLQSDLSTTSPTAGVYQDLGTVTINNRYITANSIILADVVAKVNGGGNPDPKNSVFQVEVQSRTAGSCVVRISMTPFVTDPGTYQGSDYLRLAYLVINPGK